MGRDPGDIVTTRLGTMIVAPTKEEAERRRLAWMAAHGVDEATLAARLIWGDPHGVGDMAQRFVDAGLDGLIFNMPAGTSPEDVALAGATLTERFGT